MRQAGYFISHGRGIQGDKSAGNFGVNYLYDKKSIFDGHDWAGRKPGQPFFAQVATGEPHRTFDKSHRPSPRAPIPPYYPEHPMTWKSWTSNQTVFLGRQRVANSPTEWLRYRTVAPIHGHNAGYVRLRVRLR
jgi:hypothetical protein